MDSDRTGNRVETERGRSNSTGSIRIYRNESSAERTSGSADRDYEKLLSENGKLEKQQKKLQQEINKMVQSKEVMERNIHAYDKDVKWQLAEPGALMSAKHYRDKKELLLVEGLKEVVKNLTIKCVQLTEQGKKLTPK